jgi:cell division protease FtsH
VKNWTLYVLLLVILLAIFVRGLEQGQEIEPYSKFYSRFQSGEIFEMHLSDKVITYRIAADPEKRFMAYGALDDGDLKKFREKEIHVEDPDASTDEKKVFLDRIRIKVTPPSDIPWWVSIIGSWFPILIVVFLWFYFLQKIQGGGTKAMSFGKSRARFLDTSKTRTTFQDVAGADEAKDDLQEIISFLRHPKKFQRIGARIPRGVLLVGPPGTGKTLLARAVAGEAKVPFLHISGSDFVEMFVGVGASRVRDLFEQGKKHAPCLLFIDEIDAVGRQRGAGLGGGHDEREQTLNQLLVEMDGFETNEGLILLAATNRPDVLDPALLRPGRFDRQVFVDLPDVVGREGIFKVHIQEVPTAEDVDLKKLSRATPGFSGADIANMVNEGALQAARFGREKVAMGDLEDARDKVLMGPERKSRVITDQIKEKTAWHEAGHALVSRLVGQRDAVHKVSVIPRGRALGVTSFLPDEVSRMEGNREDLLHDLATAMGGRCAEEVRFGMISAGAADDIRRASSIARRMVCELGMSEKLGPVAYSNSSATVFLGRELQRERPYSEATAALIDAEVTRLVTDGYDTAKRLLQENEEVLERIAEALLVREVLSGEELELLIEGRELPPIEQEAVEAVVEEPKNPRTQDQAEEASLGMGSPGEFAPAMGPGGE